MILRKELLLAFYGDDFTGSTDALESLSRSGAHTVLFIEPPTLEQVRQYEGVQAIGIAGISRSLAPADMERELSPALEALKQLSPRHVHYKVCSTFDSSPSIGSIGKAIEIGAEIFCSQWVPILVAAPSLGRYCTFGNLFARMGIGSQGVIHRLDRHPSMSVHPITPAYESDLRLHLAPQTERTTGLFDILQIEQPTPSIHFRELLQKGFDNILFDALYDHHLLRIGQLLDENAPSQTPLFSVGSSGIGSALGTYWQQTGQLQTRTAWESVEIDMPILVVSGSCSPVSAQQIIWAEQHGFASLAIDTAAVVETENTLEVLEIVIQEAIQKIHQGQSVIIHTSKDNKDPRIAETNRIFEQKGLTPAQIRSQTGQLFGNALGMVAQEVVAQTNLQRVVVAGGDTSSYAARAMGIEAVEMLAPLTPGAPICLAHAPTSALDGKQVIFKGGQVGAENYYEAVRGVSGRGRGFSKPRRHQTLGFEKPNRG